jgi:hypothetical protein
MAAKSTTTAYFSGSYAPWLACVFFVASSQLVHGQERATGKKSPDISVSLQAPVGFTWSDRALREGLGNLAKETGVPIWLDRRVAPDHRVTFSAKNTTLETGLVNLVLAEQLSFTTVGAVVYIGPPNAHARLQGLLSVRRKSLATLPVNVRAKWNAACALTWEELTEPREIVAKIAEKVGAKCEDVSQVPHDVWPAWQGPALPAIDLLSLVLIGFERTVEWSADGRSFKIVPAPSSISYDETYTVAGDVIQVGKELKRILPEVSLKREGTSKIIATASAEDHLKIAELLAGKKVTTKTVVKPAEKRYTLTVENQPRGAVVKTLAAELGLALKFAAELNPQMTERISLSVKQVTAEDLLKQLLEPVKLRAELGKEELTVLAK